jgi:hypothetical protein
MLVEDLEALKQLFSTDTPPKRVMHSTKQASAIYAFGDASGNGFDSTFSVNGIIHNRSRQWSREYATETFNYRELVNLLLAIEKAQKVQLLNQAELFFFTENSLAQSAFFKGTSSSRKLYELTLRLRHLEMQGNSMMHCIHISGKRIIAQGAYELSRGITNDGVMRGGTSISFVPLHLNALEHQGPSLVEWAEAWFARSPSKVNWLTPEDWFDQGHHVDNCVWYPAPAAAEAAHKQLAKAVHKRPNHTDLILIPCLMTVRW